MNKIEILHVCKYKQILLLIFSGKTIQNSAIQYKSINI